MGSQAVYGHQKMDFLQMPRILMILVGSTELTNEEKAIMKHLSFSINGEVSDLGVKAVAARIIGVQNTDSNAEFEAYKNAALEKIRERWMGRDYKADPVLAGFRDLHGKVGRSNRDYVASPEALRRSLVERGRFPRINTVVDLYNLASLQTGLALGAHDVDKLEGNITLRLMGGDEKFIPLGAASPTAVFLGEYGYIDGANNLICRMEVVQGELTKVTLDTNDIFLIVEGNVNASDRDVWDVADDACWLITKYCGGEYSFLNTS